MALYPAEYRTLHNHRCRNLKYYMFLDDPLPVAVIRKAHSAFDYDWVEKEYGTEIKDEF
jgi:hypothetical protein